MNREITKSEGTTHNELGEAEKLHQVLNWTRNIPDVALLVGRPSRVRRPVVGVIDNADWISHFSKVALVRSSNQFREGQTLGLYPQISETKKQPTILPELNIATEQLFPKGLNISAYMEWGYTAMSEHSYGEPYADDYAIDFVNTFTQYKGLDSRELKSAPRKGAVTSKEYFGVPVIVFEKKRRSITNETILMGKASYPGKRTSYFICDH